MRDRLCHAAASAGCGAPLLRRSKYSRAHVYAGNALLNGRRREVAEVGVQFETLTGHGGVHGTVAIDAIHDKAYRSAADARGSFAQAIGTSYGDRTSKLRGLTDAYGRSRLIILLSGNINDMTVAGKLIETAAGRFDYLIVDRSCDANAIRAAIAAQGAEGVILSTSSRLAPIACESDAYRAGNLVESLRCRLRDWRCRNMMRQAR